MMLAAAFIYSVVLIGPDGWLKATARAVGTPGWFVYAAASLLFSVGVVPGFFWVCVRLSQALAGKERATRLPALSRLGNATACSPLMRRRSCRWAWRSGPPLRCHSP